MLFADSQGFGDPFVGPAANKEKFNAFQLPPIAAFPPARDLFGESGDDRGLFEPLLFAPAGDAAGPPLRAGHNVPFASRTGGERLGKSLAAAGLPHVVHAFMGGDPKQIVFDRFIVREMGQRVVEAEQCLLNDVFAGRAITNAGVDVGVQTSFETVDQFPPCGLIARA